MAEPASLELAEAVEERRRRWRFLFRGLRLARQKPLGTVSALIIVALVVVALFADRIATHDPVVTSRDILQGPSSSHYFGTDQIGRDVFSRIIYGSRISLRVGIIAVLTTTVIGTIIGVISAYYGGAVDMMVQRVVDTVIAFPGLIFLMVLVGVMGQSINNVIIALTVLYWTRTARVARGSTLSVKEMPYVEAARTVGAGGVRIMLLHILPNIMAPIIVIATAALGTMILIEAALSFLGLGVPPPHPSWGNMLSGEARVYFVKAPWMAVFPGVAITLVVMAFNLLGDAMRDVLDPRLRGAV